MLRDTLAGFDVKGGDAGGVINIPVFVFRREKFKSDILQKSS